MPMPAPPPPSDGSSATEHHEAPEPTISELISSLTDAFQLKCFAEVESILIRRENKMKEEIASLRDRYEIERCKRLRAEDELKEVRSEYLTLREGRTEFVEKLRRENCGLKCAKLRAESEVQLYKKRFEELEARVSGLEKDLELLCGDPVTNRGKGRSGEWVLVEMKWALSVARKVKSFW